MKNKITLTNDDISNIIKQYQEETIGVEALAGKFNVGKLKIKAILNQHNIPIKKKGAQITTGDLYTKLGFSLVNITKPNYCYHNSKVAKNKRLHKFGFGKSSLKKKYPELHFSKTERELTLELGYDRIWDYGLFKYELIC